MADTMDTMGIADTESTGGVSGTAVATVSTGATGETPTSRASNERPVKPDKPDGYAYRIPIRMTREERATIGRKAQAANLSMSRYLVASAMQHEERAEQHRHLEQMTEHNEGYETNLCPGDQARLRRFQSYFDEAAIRLRSLSALPVFKGPGGDEMQRAARLRETLCVLESLSTEISRRLP